MFYSRDSTSDDSKSEPSAWGDDKDEKEFSNPRGENHIISIFRDHVEDIKRQQGFLKDTEEILTVCNFLTRSFVPRSRLSNPKNFKKANKLLTSLKLYSEEIFDHGKVFEKYKNVRQNYKFLKKVPTECDISNLVSCEDFPDQSCSYQEKTIKVEEGRWKSLFESDRVASIVQTERDAVEYFTHKQKIKRTTDCFITPRLKKKYSRNSDLEKDLYSIFLMWVSSKKKAGENYNDVKFDYWVKNADAQHFGRWNKSYVRFYKDFDQFKKFLHAKHDDIPKRFWRIMKFVKCLLEKKKIKLDTVNESMISTTLIRNEKNNLVPAKDLKVTISKKFLKWYDEIFDCLLKTGYLSESDKYTMDLYSGANFKTSQFTFYPGSRYRKIMRVKSSLRSVLLRYVQKNYLKEDDELPKEKIKKIIYDNLFVTKLRKSMSQYLDYEDLYVRPKEIKEEDMVGITYENFKTEMLERFSIPIYDIVFEDELSLYGVALFVSSVYQVQCKHYATCEKCRTLSCGRHTEFKDITRQKLTENSEGLSKREIRGILSKHEDQFYNVAFDREMIERKILLSRRLPLGRLLDKDNPFKLD